MLAPLPTPAISPLHVSLNDKHCDKHCDEHCDEHCHRRRTTVRIAGL